MHTTFDNTEDVIDSRSIIERIGELENNEERGTEEQVELDTLLKLQEDAEGYSPDWQYGSTLIRYSYFTEYCQELLEDIGDLPKDFPHYIEIDWEKTADNLKVDYTEVDYDGVTYLIR